jgi:hypothetical protein
MALDRGAHHAVGVVTLLSHAPGDGTQSAGDVAPAVPSRNAILCASLSRGTQRWRDRRLAWTSGLRGVDDARENGVDPHASAFQLVGETFDNSVDGCFRSGVSGKSGGRLEPQVAPTAIRQPAEAARASQGTQHGTRLQWSVRSVGHMHKKRRQPAKVGAAFR